ncbi:MAG: hypothetical protein ACLPYZ_11635 [Limisphaerales bacterium]
MYHTESPADFSSRLGTTEAHQLPFDWPLAPVVLGPVKNLESERVSPRKMTCLDWSHLLRLLLHRLDFSGLPGLVEPWLQRTVEAEDRVPAFAGKPRKRPSASGGEHRIKNGRPGFFVTGSAFFGTYTVI